MYDTAISSSFGLGSVLLQESTDASGLCARVSSTFGMGCISHWARRFWYVSRSMNETKQCYAQIEKEALQILRLHSQARVPHWNWTVSPVTKYKAFGCFTFEFRPECPCRGRCRVETITQFTLPASKLKKTIQINRRSSSILKAHHIGKSETTLQSYKGSNVGRKCAKWWSSAKSVLRKLRRRKSHASSHLYPTTPGRLLELIC